MARDQRLNPYSFSTHVGVLCVKAQKNVYQLGPAIGSGPQELLDMMNGGNLPTKAMIQGLARELDSDPKHPDKLAE